MRFARSRPGNTFDAHRLLHLARDRGVQDEVKERLLAGYFTDGESIGDPETLVRLAGEAGIDRDEAAEVLAGDKYTDDVRSDEEEAAALGIHGVPFFVIDRKYAVSGAQPADVLLEVLDRSWDETHPLEVIGDSGAACDGDACPI